MASKRHLRRRSCESKIRYETSTEANRRAGVGRWTYLCGFCGLWHNGRPPRRVWQSARAKKQAKRA